MEITRGDIVVVALAGDYGKPRPALVIQADAFAKLPSLTVLPLTSDRHDEPLLRIEIQPSAMNGLRKPSHIMVDKVSTIAKHRLGARLGNLNAEEMGRINLALATFLGIVAEIPTTARSHSPPTASLRTERPVPPP